MNGFPEEPEEASINDAEMHCIVTRNTVSPSLRSDVSFRGFPDPAGIHRMYRMIREMRLISS